MKSIRRIPGRKNLNVEIVLSLQIYVRREEYEKKSAGQSNLAWGFPLRLDFLLRIRWGEGGRRPDEVLSGNGAIGLRIVAADVSRLKLLPPE
jgi:hypothetical protein